MKCDIFCLIYNAKETIQKDGCATLKVTLFENYRNNNVALIQLILQTVSGVQNHVELANVDHAKYCVLVTILQMQLPIKHME